MKKKPILIVPVKQVDHDLAVLLARVAAGARVFIEKDKRLIAELRGVDDQRAPAPTEEPALVGPADLAPPDLAEGRPGLRDRARELFLDEVPLMNPIKARRRKPISS
jgi:antitoxin (DNA-binding transcriptional repressor) of toxin-antitoxin stability system